jgi:hypothetical protein
MPQQTVFLQEEIGDKSITVLKTYDQQFAREVFDDMDDTARAELVTALHLENDYEVDGLTFDGDVIWEELVDQAREDYRLFSFFVVIEATGAKSGSLFVSPDWPSAERFAKNRIASERR